MLHTAFGRRRAVAAAAFVLLCAAAVCAALASPAGAFVPTYQPTWAKSLDSGYGLDDYLSDVLVTGDGTVWACGSGTKWSNDKDVFLVRVPANGLRASRYTWSSGPRSLDAAVALARAPSGSIYTVGFSTSVATGADLRIVKWSAAGKVLWTRRYDGAAHKYDQGSDVVVDRYGNVTVCGTTTAAGGTPDWIVVSWSSSGVLRWAKRYDREGAPDEPRALCVDSIGNVYVTGYASHDYDTSVATTIKYSRAGTVLWRRGYLGADGLEATATSIARAPHGGVYVAGRSSGAVTSGPLATCQLVLRYSASGVRSVVVEEPLKPGAGYASALAVRPDGKIVTGGTQRDDLGVSCPAAWLFGPDGTLAANWVWSSGGLGTMGGISDVTVNKAGDLFWAGWLKGQNAGDDEYVPLICRRNPDAAAGDWNGGWAAGGYALPAACAASGSALYVVGHHVTATKGTNMFVLKYQP